MATSTIPDKPSGDRDTLTIRELDITLETPTQGELNEFQSKRVEEGTFDPERINSLVEANNRNRIEFIWQAMTEANFNNVHTPTPVFDTVKKDINGVEVPIVQTKEFGRTNRSVLKRHPRFNTDMNGIGKRICLQHVYSSEKPPKDVCGDVPYNFFPYDVMRVREFIQNHEFVWMNGIDRHWTERTPVGNDELNGLLYLMYEVDDAEIIPRYIGISQRESTAETDDGLNWNFENVRQDSVFARWGYGSSQHIGELSKALLTDQYPDASVPQKYQTWVDELFYEQTRILTSNVYIQLLPFMDNVHRAEENMVTLADYLYSDSLLNVEYTDRRSTQTVEGKDTI